MLPPIATAYSGSVKRTEVRGTMITSSAPNARKASCSMMSLSFVLTGRVPSMIPCRASA